MLILSLVHVCLWGTCQKGGDRAMSQSGKKEDGHECAERCYKEGMVISTTGEASLILT